MTDCAKCSLAFSKISKIYSVTGGEFTLHFDVGLALKLARDLEPLIVPPWLIDRGLLVNTYDVAHLDHVDMGVPVLFGTLPSGPEITRQCVVPDDVDPENPDFRIFVFLDGSHRAARAIRDGLELKGKFLNIPDTYKCILAIEEAPPK